MVWLTEGDFAVGWPPAQPYSLVRHDGPTLEKKVAVSYHSDNARETGAQSMAEPPGELPDFDALWDYDDPDATRARFEELVDAYGEQSTPAWRLALMTQIARTLGLARRFDDAHVWLDRVEAELTDEPDLLVPRLRLLLERGRALRSEGRTEEARSLFIAAWDRALGGGQDAWAVDAAHMVALVESGEEALEWNQRALELAELSDEPRTRRWRASLYNNIGWTLHDQGRYEEALDIFERALAFREKEGRPKPTRIARWAVARCLRSLGRVEEALEIQRELAATTEEPDGYVDEELGECLAALGFDDQAQPYFADAYRRLSSDPALAQSEPERLARLARLGGAEPPVPLPPEGDDPGA
jgi:tetratricopeptide (TPR) repeat protein